MKTRVVRIDQDAEVHADLLEDLSGVLLAGGVLVYPTETYYGLGAAAFSLKGVRAVYRAKRRDRAKPLSVMASDMDMVARIAAGIPAQLRRLAGEFWPGPLTVVLVAAAEIPDFLRSESGTIAVRIPPAGWVRRLVHSISQPLTATSANLSGGRAVSSPDEAVRLFSGRVHVIVDGGDTPGGLPSTLLDLTRDPPSVLREGAIPSDAIRTVLGTGRSGF